jgi:hypothetical protein
MTEADWPPESWVQTRDFRFSVGRMHRLLRSGRAISTGHVALALDATYLDL